VRCSYKALGGLSPPHKAVERAVQLVTHRELERSFRAEQVMMSEDISRSEHTPNGFYLKLVYRSEYRQGGGV
jgi:hypothetical protein